MNSYYLTVSTGILYSLSENKEYTHDAFLKDNLTLLGSPRERALFLKEITPETWERFMNTGEPARSSVFHDGEGRGFYLSYFRMDADRMLISWEIGRAHV